MMILFYSGSGFIRRNTLR